MGKQIKFGFDNVESADSAFKGRIEPGVHEVIITGITSETSKNDKSYVSIKCENVAKTREHEERMFTSTPKGTEFTKSRIKHLVQKVTGKSLKGEVSIEQLEKVLKGKSIRIKFIGEQYEYNNDIRTRTNFAFMGFAESLSVTEEDSALSYDSSNPYDFKPLEGVESGASDYSSEDNKVDEMPDEDLF